MGIVIYTNKLHAGDQFPDIEVQLLSDEKVNLSKPTNGADWKLVVVYRGVHCPLCTKYLNELEQYVSELKNSGIDIVAVSGDSKKQLEQHHEQLTVSYPLAYGLTETQMSELGLYVSVPRSEQETDHNFPEPGLFVINQDSELQVVDISNSLFTRPDLATLVSGLQWIKIPSNNYPIRGTFLG
jgi:peroxiredoxin